MNVSQLKRGDRIRVAYDLTVKEVRNGIIAARRGDHSLIYRNPGALKNFSVEILEPDYVDQAFYLDVDGKVWQYRKESTQHWWKGGLILQIVPAEPARPIVRLVPEGDRCLS